MNWVGHQSFQRLRLFGGAMVAAIVFSGCNSHFSAKRSRVQNGSVSPIPPAEVFSTPQDGGILLHQGLNQVAFSGLCVKPSRIIELKIADASPVIVPCNEGVWTATLDLSSYPDGPILIQLLAKNGQKVGLFSSTLTVIKDTVLPAIKFKIPMDPLVARGETVPIRLSIDGTGSSVSKRSYRVSWDGVTYENRVDLSSDEFNLQIPSSASSTKNAKIKIFAEDVAGNIGEATSASFQIMTKSSKLIGNYATARGGSFGPPDQARLQLPHGLATDGTYIYVGEACLIRRIKIADGVSERLAGYMNLCETVDGIDGSIKFISAVAIQGDWLYFTEPDSHLVRRVNKNQASPDFRKLETFAGRRNESGGTDAPLGVDARFNRPVGLAISGNFAYVTNTSGHTLRRIDLSTSEVTTLAGSYLTPGSANGVGGSARFSAPSQIAFDDGPSSGAQGSIFISDINNFKIRRYDIATGNVTDFIGTSGQPGSIDGTGAAATIRGIRGLASDGTYLYLADNVMHVIRRVTISSRVTTTIAGVMGDASFQDGNPSKLNGPTGLIVIGTDLYIADGKNYLIRKMDVNTFNVARWIGMSLGSTPEFHPLKSQRTGDGALIDNASAVVTDDGNDLYVPFSHANVVSKLSISGNQMTTIAGQVGMNGIVDGIGSSARFRMPSGAVKIGTKLYVVDRFMHSVRMIDLSTNEVTTIAGSTAGSFGYFDDTTGTTALFNGPWSIAKSADNLSLYIGEIFTRRIRQVSLTPPYAVSTIAGSNNPESAIDDNAVGLSAKFENPRGMVVVGNFLYVTDGSTALRRIDLNPTGSYPVVTVAGSYPSKQTGFVDGVGNDARFNVPHGIAASGQTLYISDFNNDAIRTFDIASGVVSTFAGLSAFPKRGQNGFGRSAFVNAPRGLAIFDDSMFVTSTDGGPGIVKFDLISGQTEALTGANFSNRAVGQLDAAYREGELIATDANHRSLGCVTGDGTKLYAIEISGTILSYNLDMSGETLLAGVHNLPGHLDGVGASARLTAPDAGGCALYRGHLYFTQPMTNTVRRLDLTSREVSTVAGNAADLYGIVDSVGASARLQRPTSVTILGENLYFVDANGLMLRKLDLKNFQVSTVLGSSTASGTVDGVAPAARLEGIKGLATIDSHIYLSSATSTGGTIRRYVPSTGQIETVVGSSTQRGDVEGIGAAVRFRAIDRISSDGVNLWISDSGSFVMYKMRPSTLEVKRVYGNGSLREDSFGPLETTDTTNPAYWVPGMGLISLSITGFQTAIFD